MTNPVNTITGEASQLANDLGTVAGKSAMFLSSPLSEGSGRLLQNLA